MYLITGASQGIGFECARALLERTSSRVLITARHRAGLLAARQSLDGGRSSRLDVQACDQSLAVDVQRLIESVDASTEPLLGAVLNVGMNPRYVEGPRRLHQLSLETIHETVLTNCTHLAYLSGQLLLRLRGRPGACIVWVGSLAADVAPPGSGIYSATKSFLTGLVRTADHEYGHRGVRVHLVHPGPTRTPRIARHLGAGPVREASDVGARIADLLIDGSPLEREIRL
jgi:NAD(P)-dependent dehydrogenase (short-subunit alcohol dehydrogenase family)